MKTYLLKPHTVEPQNTSPSAAVASSALVLPALAEDIANPPSGLRPRAPELFIGLDVHNDSIAVSIAPGDSTE